MSDELNKPQPTPQPGRVDVVPLVLDDLRERGELGQAKYGTPLQTHNGRDPLIDAYQEVLDLSVYLRQTIAERRPVTRTEQVLRAEVDARFLSHSNRVAQMLV